MKKKSRNSPKLPCREVSYPPLGDGRGRYTIPIFLSGSKGWLTPSVFPPVQIILCILAFTTSTLFAHEKISPTPIIAKLQSQYTNNTSASADFDMSFYSAVREKTERRSGHFSIASGGRFNVHFIGADYISDGKKVWQYIAPQHQVVILSMSQVDRRYLPGSIVEDCLGFPFVAEKVGDRFILTAHPEKAAGSPDTVKLTVSARDTTLTNIDIVDLSQDRTSYTLRHFVKGGTFKESDFTFKLPSGTDVMDRTHE